MRTRAKKYSKTGEEPARLGEEIIQLGKRVRDGGKGNRQEAFASRVLQWRRIKSTLDELMGSAEEFLLSIPTQFIDENCTDPPVFLSAGTEDDHTVYEVSPSLFSAEPDSFFSTLMSGRWNEEGKGRDSENPIALQYDDAPCVGLALLYLQRGPIILHEVPQLRGTELRQRLLQCATYFCITTLKDYLHYPLEHFNLPPSDLDIKRRTDILRHLYAMQRDHPLLNDPYLDLINIYLDPETHLRTVAPESHWPDTPILFHRPSLFPGPNSPFPPTLTRWRELFNGNSNNLFSSEDFDWSNLVVAGGMVLRALNGYRQTTGFHSCHSEYAGQDVDLFMVGLGPQEALAKLRYLDGYLRSKSDQGDEVICVRTKHAMSWVGPGIPKVQVILRLYKSPAEVLYGFDIDCVCVLYDGQYVWALPRALRALQTGCNLFDLGRLNVTFNARILKYSQRGFGLVIPGFSWNHVDWMKLFNHAPTTKKCNLGSCYFSGLIRAYFEKYASGSSFPKIIETLHPETRDVNTISRVGQALQPRPTGRGVIRHPDPTSEVDPLADRIDQMQLSDTSKSTLHTVASLALQGRATQSGHEERQGYLAGAAHALKMQEKPQVVIAPTQALADPEETEQAPPLGMKPDSGYEDTLATSAYGVYTIWISCLMHNKPIGFLGTLSLEAALEGRFEPELIDLLYDAFRGEIYLEKKERQRHGWYWRRTRPVKPREKVSKETFTAKFLEKLEQGGLMNKPLEWIRIDLDRSFIGTFHSPLAVDYFDCMIQCPETAPVARSEE